MNGTLAPKSLGDILSETFTICKKNFLRLTAIVSIVMVPFFIALIICFILLIPLSVDMGTEDPSPFILLVMIPIFLAFFPASVLMVGAIIHAVTEQYFNQPIDIGRAYKFAWRRLGAMFGAAILVGLAIFGIYLAAILISVIVASAIGGTSGWLAFAIAVPIVLVAALAAVYLDTNWNFTSQTALLEGCSPTDALSYSMSLVKQSWWRVLGIVLLLALIAQIIYMIISMIFYIPAIIAGIVTGVVGGVMPRAEAGIPVGVIGIMIWQMIGVLIGYIIYFLFFTVGHTLLYFDLRVRKEGYSLDVMADELGLPSTATDAVA